MKKIVTLIAVVGFALSSFAFAEDSSMDQANPAAAQQAQPNHPAKSHRHHSRHSAKARHHHHQVQQDQQDQNAPTES